MYIFRNALANIKRNKGRNSIVALIIISILSLVSVSMMISATSDQLVSNYKDEFGSEIFMQYDDEKIREAQNKGEWVDLPEISDDVKIAISKSEYLKETLLSVMYSGYLKDLKTISDLPSMDGGIEGMGGYYYPNTSVFGYNDLELLTSFKQGKRVMKEGNFNIKDGEVLISSALADLNGLKLGDTLVVHDPKVDALFNPLELKVSGIFTDYQENRPGINISHVKNDLITTFETLAKHQDQANERLFVVEATYYLKSPDLLESFNKEAHSYGLHENYKMATDEMSYKKIMKPAEDLGRVSNLFLIGVLGVGSVVLVLLSLLSIRERTYEIGVLRAMGMSKFNVVKGLVYESFIIMAGCLLLGITLGSVLAQPISNTLMSDTQSTGNAYVEVEPIEVSLSKEAIINVVIVAAGLAFISSSVGVIYALRYEPMKILSERGQ